MCPGYVYILMNPAMPSVLKIGKTKRSSEERATEISTPTGVPVPWHVAYEVYVADCDLVEQKIHEALKKYRVTTGKECFVVPLKEALILLMGIASEFQTNQAGGDDVGSAQIPSLLQRARKGDVAAQRCLAEEYDRAKDFAQARKWYIEAGKNGDKDVFDRLGELYYHGLGGPRQFAHAHACFWVACWNRKGKGMVHALKDVCERFPSFSKIEAEGYRQVMMSWAKPEKSTDSA